MCGINGIWTQREIDLAHVVRRMADCLRHRGPNDAGVWVDAPAGLGLGHRRLSILDLSPLGHPPMVSAGGRYVIAFNGELCNCSRRRPATGRSRTLHDEGSLRGRGRKGRSVHGVHWPTPSAEARSRPPSA